MTPRLNPPQQQHGKVEVMSKLFWIHEKVEDEPDNVYLGDKESLTYCPKGSTKEPADAENTTLEDLYEYCDSEAENANYHSFVGTHQKLANLISKLGSEAIAKAVMFEIAKSGGLHEFN